MAYRAFVTESQFNLQDAAKAAFKRDIQRESENLGVELSKLGDGYLGIFDD